MPRMGLFLNELLGPKISLLPSYSSPCFIKWRPFPTVSNPSPLVDARYNPLPSVSIWHTLLPFLRYKPFPINFRTPVLVVPIMLQPLKLVRRFLLRMRSIQEKLVKILPFSCCKPIMFLTFLLSCLSLLHMPSLVCQIVIWLWQ